jgi:ribosomal protein L29
MSKNKIDFNGMTIEEIVQQLEKARGELFSLRLGAATNPVKDPSQFKKLRRAIAQSLTFLRQKVAQQIYDSKGKI